MRITLEVVVKLNATGKWVAYLATATRVIDSTVRDSEAEALAWLKKEHPEIMNMIREEPS